MFAGVLDKKLSVEKKKNVTEVIILDELSSDSKDCYMYVKSIEQHNLTIVSPTTHQIHLVDVAEPHTIKKTNKTIAIT